jgi:hypothetical protein
VYTPALGYGRLMTETAVSSCGTGAEKTYRQVSSVESLDYRFDNLLPDRSYHLDLTFGLCSGERWVNIYVDGRQMTESARGLVGSELSATTCITTALQTVTLLLNPADYRDGSITLSLRRADGLSGPLVNPIDLREIRYCYCDADRASRPGPPRTAAATTPIPRTPLTAGAGRQRRPSASTRTTGASGSGSPAWSRPDSITWG